MKTIKKSVLVLALSVIVILSMAQLSQATEPPALSASGGGIWEHKSVIKLAEPVGLVRVDEPVEATITSDRIKAQGEDIRITDSGGVEISCQVSAVSPGSYKVAFFAQSEANSTGTYYLYYGNADALKPDYGAILSLVNNTSKTWQTDGVFIQWGGKAGYNVSGTNVITALKFDNNGDKNPANDYDCLTDEYCWNSWFYGNLSAGEPQSHPPDFGSAQAQVIATGPIFSEITLGNARIRYFKGQSWVATNQFVQTLYSYSQGFQYIKSGLGNEIFIPNNGSGNVGPAIVAHNSTTVNPQYLSFRNPNSGLVLGGIASNVVIWCAGAKCSGAWERAIAFDDSSNRPDAKIYWYADTSNGYDGIERLSKQLLNPLQVEVITDTTPPITSISANSPSVGSSGIWLTEQPQVTLSVDEPATIYYKIDDGEPIVYSSSFPMPEGTHSLSCYAVDDIGNKGAEQTIQFSVDSGAPALQVSLSPQTASNYHRLNEPVTCSYEATDIISGLANVTATVDGEPISSGETVSFPTPGVHSFTVTAQDLAGNTASKTETFTVGYDFTWLRPVKRPGDPADAPYTAYYGSLVPINFAVYDANTFVVDKSIRVVVSDGDNSAVFGYGKTTLTIRINPCDEKYLLNINPKSYPWMRPGGSYTISVYAGEKGDACIGRITLVLR